MDDMSMDVTTISEKLELESTKNNVAYDVGQYYLQAFDMGDYSAVTLFNQNLKVETQEIYTDLENENIPTITQSIHEFCEKYDFEGVESIQNRTAPMIEPDLLEHNHTQAIATLQACNRIEDSFEDVSASSFAVFRLKDNEKNEQLTQISLSDLKNLGQEPDKGNYNCIYSADLEELMMNFIEVMDNNPENFNDEFENALYNNIGFDQDFIWNNNELLDGDVIGLQYEGEITYFYNDVQGLEVIDFEQQPSKLVLRTDEIPSPTVVDLNTISSEELLNLMGNYENIENVVREIVPILHEKDNIVKEMAVLDEIDSDTIYQDFDILKSEVISYMEVALLTNSTQDMFVVSDRGEYSEKEVNDNEWGTPLAYNTLEEALNGYDDRIYAAMEMTGVFEEMEQLEQAEQQAESHQTQDVEESPSKAVAEVSVVTVTSVELAEMMKQDSELENKVAESMDLLKFAAMLDEQLPESDMLAVNELANRLERNNDTPKEDTFFLISGAMNLTYMEVADIQKVSDNDLVDCIIHGGDVTMLQNRVEVAKELEALEIDNSPEAHAEIQSFFEEPIPKEDLERFTELVAKTTAMSEENSREMIFEYLISEIGDGYISTSDLHFLEPQDIDKAINSHGGILVDQSVQLHNVAEHNKQIYTKQEPSVEEQSAEHLSYEEVKDIAQGENAGIVAISGEDNLFSATLTTQERVLIKESAEFVFDYNSDIPEEQRDMLRDVMEKVDPDLDLLQFYPTDYVFEPNEALHEVTTVILSEEELEAIAFACDETSQSWDNITKDYSELLDNLIEKVSNPQTAPSEISNEVAQEPRTVADYTITDSEVVGDFEIAMGESEQGMYATWERCISADESKGFEANWNFGHYHMEDKEGAMSDFKQRIEDTKPVKDTELEKKVVKKEKDKDEKPPKESVLESLKKIKAETEQKEVPKLPTKEKSDQSL